MRVDELPLFRYLEGAERILIAGAGGGFDVFSGLPLYFALTRRGKRVSLASLSFSKLDLVDGPRLAPTVAEVTASSDGSTVYFPERYLCEHFAAQGEELSIFCFEPSGVVPLTESYGAVAAHLDLDAIVLVDGGTDILMRGDEVGLGTPSEDISSLAAASAAAAAAGIDRGLVVCVGFGVDTYHGVCHAQYLENVAALAREGAFLGAFSLLQEQQEVQRYVEAVESVNSSMREAPSIVHSSVVSAVEGRYGDHHRVHRTQGSELWINPLMALCWAFELQAVAGRVLYLDAIRETQTIMDVTIRIEAFRKGLATIKDWETIPV